MVAASTHNDYVALPMLHATPLAARGRLFSFWHRFVRFPRPRGVGLLAAGAGTRPLTRGPKKPKRRGLRKWAAALSGLAFLLGVHACSLEQDGEPPPRDVFYFPTAVALGRDAETGRPDYLYVVNSNFDRKYNSGNVLAIDLDKLQEKIAGTLEAADDQERETGVGGACSRGGGRDCLLAHQVAEDDWRVPEEVIADEVVIGSLGRGAALSRDGTRLYVPTAADAELTFIDIDKGDGSLELSCGQGSGRRCAGGHLVGQAGSDDDRREMVDPVGVIAGAFGDFASGQRQRSEYVIVAYSAGAVALFSASEDGPVLADVSANLAGNLTGLAYDPAGRVSLVTSRALGGGGARTLQRVGLLADPSEHVFRLAALELEGVTSAQDTWAIQVVSDAADNEEGTGDSGGDENEGDAGDGEDARQSTAFVVSRQPNALLRVPLVAGLPAKQTVEQIAPVGQGPARLALGSLPDPDREGDLRIAVVSCFDERRLFIIDRDLGRALSIVPGFSGSFELAVDEARELIYVADFSASVVRVVSVQGLAQGRQARIIATLGRPNLVEVLQ